MADAARSAAGVAVLAVAFALALASAAAGAAAVPQPDSGAAAIGDGDDSAGGARAVDPTVAAAEPTLSVLESVNRSANLTATVSLPASAEGTERFVLRLRRVSGGTVANRTLSLSPGDTATVDFDACLAATNYLVQVATPDGDVLVADQVRVEQAIPLVALGDTDPLRSAFEPTVARDETLPVSARLHSCVDRAMLSLTPRAADADALWRATVVDADGDGRVAFDWDLDAPGDARLAAADGTELAPVDGPRGGDEPVPYGEYDVRTSTTDGDGRSGHVTVSFADPRVTVYTADGSLDATDAIAAARDGDPVDSEYTVRVADGEWVVLRVDTDGTLDDLPGDAELVAPARHENVTVRVQGTYGPMESDGPNADLANATRRFDSASGTLWYAYRASAGNERTRFEYAALSPSWNATAAAEVSGVVPVRVGVENGDLLAPERVALDGDTPYADGTTLNVSVRANGRVLATDRVTVEDRRFDARLDLSGVANGTNASVVVRTDGRVVHRRAVVVAARPAFELDGFGVPGGLAVDDPATVAVYVANRGTTTGNTTVRVTLGNVTRSRTLQIAAGERESAEFEFPPDALPAEGDARIEVSAAGTTDARSEPVDRSTTPAPPSTRSATTGVTSNDRTGTGAWPTLVGSERGPDADTVPGFGETAAVAALAATVVALLARAGSR